MQIHPVPKPPSGEDPVLPDCNIALVAGTTGLFKVVRNPFYTACVKLDGIPSLAAIEEFAELHVPVLPLELFRQVEAFFVEVYAQHQSEAVVLLYCNPVSRAWRIAVPPQEVRGLHVTYDLDALPEAPAGFERFGTIHSHANIKAFHSGTDDADEAHFDGLHVTIGNVDKPGRTYACRWILAGKAFPAELSAVVETLPLPEPSLEWLGKVKKAEVVESDAWPLLAARGVADADRPGVDLDIFGESYTNRDEYLDHLQALREEIDERLWEAEDLQLQGDVPCSEEANTSL